VVRHLSKAGILRLDLSLVVHFSPSHNKVNVRLDISSFSASRKHFFAEFSACIWHDIIANDLQDLCSDKIIPASHEVDLREDVSWVLNIISTVFLAIFVVTCQAKEAGFILFGGFGGIPAVIVRLVSVELGEDLVSHSWVSELVGLGRIFLKESSLIPGHVEKGK